MTIKEITEKVVAVSDNYADSCSVNRDADWYILKLQEEIGELMQQYLSFTRRGRSRGKTIQEIKESFAGELADVFGQVLLIAYYHGINIEDAMEHKWFSYLKS